MFTSKLILAGTTVNVFDEYTENTDCTLTKAVISYLQMNITDT